MRPANDEPLPSLAELAMSGPISARMTAQCLEAVARRDAKGPTLHAMIAVNPKARAQAREFDAGPAGGARRGALHGAPIVVKDNIETAEALATTAGSLALANHVTGRDAPCIARLRAAGAVIIGKANLSAWANFRSAHSRSGWSAMGGQCRNAVNPTRSPCGSSSGSAVAVAAGMAAAAIGTETDGSITCPAAVNGVVGFKPSLGLVSQKGIVPISHFQDTAGPIARTVKDAAIVLSAMAGGSGRKGAAAVDYAAGLGDASAKGLTVGVMRFAAGFHPATDVVFEAALAALRAAGAVCVDIADGPDIKAIGEAEELALVTEFRPDLDAYLQTTSPDQVSVRTLEAVIAFNRQHADREMAFFGQDLLERALNAADLNDPDYVAARNTAVRLAGAEGIERMLAETGAAVLVAPTMGPAWLIDDLLKDHCLDGPAMMLAAVAGAPHLTIPMGRVGGMPVGLSILGPAGSDARVLAAGHAFEQALAAVR